jgi:hypothetical protein
VIFQFLVAQTSRLRIGSHNCVRSLRQSALPGRGPQSPPQAISDYCRANRSGDREPQAPRIYSRSEMKSQSVAACTYSF